MEAVATMRSRAEALIGFARDPDVRVRRAAIPGLGLFIDDVDRASTVLLGRLPAESGIIEQLLIVEAMAALAMRLPERAETQAMAWFTELATDSAVAPQTRLAAVVQRARCAPERMGDDTIATALGLLRELDDAAVPAEAWCDPPRPEAAPASGDGAPPQVVAAFEDLERHRQIHSPTTDLLRSFHLTLAERVPQRTALLAEQLRSRDLGSRLDAVRMSAELMRAWRGDHARLIMLVAEHLNAPQPHPHRTAGRELTPQPSARTSLPTFVMRVFRTLPRATMTSSPQGAVAARRCLTKLPRQCVQQNLKISPFSSAVIGASAGMTAPHAGSMVIPGGGSAVAVFERSIISWRSAVRRTRPSRP